MAENHMKYMPHHPKPKYVNGGTPNMVDPGIRQRSEPTSHDGSYDQPTDYPNFHESNQPWGQEWQ